MGSERNLRTVNACYLLNSSYLSKKEVPGAIGNPAANPQYWVVTGHYNGQIAQLQNDIQTLNNEIQGIDALIKSVTVTPEMFGAVGDGITDDTAAVEEALTYAFVEFDKNYKITDMIQIGNNCVITGAGSHVYCDGDTDYWLYINGYDVNISGVYFEKVDANFIHYNRAVRFEQCDDAHISECHFKNFGTSVHSANGNMFTCENILIEETYGDAAQYGYGIDTSSKHNIINGIVGKNTAPTSGRHLIYLNGSIMESATVSNIYCANWLHHPIDISVHDQSPIKAMIKISNVDFDTVNVDPVGSNKEMCAINSSVNTTAYIQVDNVTFKNMNTGLLFFRGASITAVVTNLTAYLTTPIYGSQTAVKFRDLTNAIIKNVKMYNRASTMTYALEVRDCIDAIIDEIYDVTSETPDYGLSANGGSMYLGDYISTATQKIRQTSTPTISIIERYSI